MPATYLALEDVVTQLASERRTRGVDPVLNGDQYRNIVTSEMQFRFRKSFRDQAELHQATIFLHENGMLSRCRTRPTLTKVDTFSPFLIAE